MIFKPIAVCLGLRYTRATQKNHFISFISGAAMLGIALGVMVLITVLSVMNGFDEEIHKRFFGMAPEISITGRMNTIDDWHALEKKLTSISEIRYIAPYVGGQALLTYEGQAMPIVLTGILPERELPISHIDKKLVLGKIGQLQHFGIFLGQNLAEHLGVGMGDAVTIMIPKVSTNITGMTPRFKTFKVAGIFSAGSGFNFDTHLAFIDIHDAQILFQLGSGVTGLKLRIKHPYEAPNLSLDIERRLGPMYEIGNWTDQFGAFFHAIKMEKTMMFFILILIIAVAAFNLVSSLVMLVHDKASEIAILRTIGATPAMILRIFMTQGMIVGLVGTGLGILFGILLAYNATSIVDHIQDWLHIKLISANVYFVDYLPSKIMASDLWMVSSIALLMSFVATLYPAYKALKLNPSEAIRTL